MKRIALALWVSLTVFDLAVAQPQISGPLSGTLGPGAYLVVGDCSVNGGQTLTLRPGTTFLFAGHYSLRILAYGTLCAVGTDADSIVFTHQNPDTSCDWSGIRFLYGSYAASVISYCRIEYARYHLQAEGSGGGLSVQGPGMTISQCLISNNEATNGGGIWCNVAPVTISDCIFLDNSAVNGGGLHLQWNANATVSNCVFAGNTATGT